MQIAMIEESNSPGKKLPEAVANAVRQVLGTGYLDRWVEATEERLKEPARQFDPDFMKRLVPLMDLFMSYFDGEVRGIERVPASPALLIGNHSGGAITPDTSAVYAAWYRARGFDDPLLGLAFDAAFSVPKFGDLMRKIGQMPASMDNAEAALNDGQSVLLYPGGTHEVFRPWKERNRVVFKERTGFIRLALKTSVPVVPVVGHGGHETLVVLSRGERLGRMMGTDLVRMDGAPILWQLPWGLSTPAFPGIPLPAKITVQVCEPLDWSAHGPEAADDPEVLQRCYDEITSVMQSALDALAAENPRPIRSRLKKVLRR